MEGRSGNVKKIVIATKNKGKIREMKDSFRELPVEIVALSDFGELPDAVEDGQTFKENAMKKAKFYMEKTGCACMADDSGLCVDALDGAPGIYSARFSGEHANDAKNNEKLVAELRAKGLKDSAAAYHCALVFVDTDGKTLDTEGICEGTICTEARGSNGFGYDPHFYINGKSMAEHTLEEKSAISHRGRAVRAMVALLGEYL